MHYVTLFPDEFLSLISTIASQNNSEAYCRIEEYDTQYLVTKQSIRIPFEKTIVLGQINKSCVFTSTSSTPLQVFYALEKMGFGICLHQSNKALTLFIANGHLKAMTSFADLNPEKLLDFLQSLLFIDSATPSSQRILNETTMKIDSLRLDHTINLAKSLQQTYENEIIQSQHPNDVKTPSAFLNDWISSDKAHSWRWDLPLCLGRIYESFLPYRLLITVEPDWIWVSKHLVMRLPNLMTLSDEEFKSLLNHYAKGDCPASLHAPNQDDSELDSLIKRMLSLNIRQHNPIRIKTGSKVWIRWDGGRKASGSYYTPPALAYSTTVTSINPRLVEINSNHILDIKICDPSMGAGIFLICAHRFLTFRFIDSFVHNGPLKTANKNIPNLEPTHFDSFKAFYSYVQNMIASCCLHGVDINHNAVALFERMLPHANIVCGDALTGTLFHEDRKGIEIHRIQSPSDDDPTDFNETKRGIVWPNDFPNIKDGFDVVLGNPPWESHKPNAKSFFERFDPALRFLSRHRVNQRISHLLDSPDLKRRWEKELNKYAIRSTFFRQIRHHRDGPYRYQGIGDGNYWKLFLELSHALLNSSGTLGLIVPGNLVSDKGASDLRSLLINRCQWRWYFGFWNEKRIFEIDSTYRFAVVIADSKPVGEPIKFRFFASDLKEWMASEPDHIQMNATMIRTFSKQHLLIQSLSSQRDVDVLYKMYSNGIELGHINGLHYGSGLHMTTYAKQMQPADYWLEKGFLWGENACLFHSDGREALPVYEGRMIDRFDACAKHWISGKGRHAIWKIADWDQKVLKPQYWIEKCHVPAKHLKPRIGFKAISRPTIKRTMSAVYLDSFPAGNAIGSLWHSNSETLLIILAALNSIGFDYMVKHRCSGLNLNWHILEELVLPPSIFDKQLSTRLVKWATQLSFFMPHIPCPNKSDQPKFKSQQIRIEIQLWLDVLIAHAYQLSLPDVEYICRECDHSVLDLTNREFRQTLDPKGFWRMDKELPVQNRYPIRFIRAYQQFLMHAEIDLQKAFESGENALNDLINQNV